MKKFIITTLLIVETITSIFADQYLMKLKVTEKPNECWTTMVIDAQTYSAFINLFGGKKPVTKEDVTTTQLDIERVNKFYNDCGQPVGALDAKLVYYKFVGEKY